VDLFQKVSLTEIRKDPIIWYTSRWYLFFTRRAEVELQLCTLMEINIFMIIIVIWRTVQFHSSHRNLSLMISFGNHEASPYRRRCFIIIYDGIEPH